MSNISGISSGLASSQSLDVAASNTLSTVANSTTQLDSPFANLNLTSAQQSQIQQILQSSQQQGLTASQVQSEIDNVLTPAQQSQLQANLSDIDKQRRGAGAKSGAGSSDGTDAFGIPTSLSSASNSGTISDIAAAYAAQSQLQDS